MSTYFTKTIREQENMLFTQNVSFSIDHFEDSVSSSNDFYDLSVLARSALAEQIAFPAPPSGQRVRLRGGGAPYSGYLEHFHADSW